MPKFVLNNPELNDPKTFGIFWTFFGFFRAFFDFFKILGLFRTFLAILDHFSDT